MQEPNITEEDMDYWKSRSLEELGVEASTEQEYIYLLTIAPSVTYGSEEYLALNLCLWRSAQLDDRDLIQYFTDLDSNLAFGYSGALISEQQDLIDALQNYQDNIWIYWYSVGISARVDLFPPFSNVNAWAEILRGIKDVDMFLKYFLDWLIEVRKIGAESRQLIFRVLIRFGSRIKEGEVDVVFNYLQEIDKVYLYLIYYGLLSSPSDNPDDIVHLIRLVRTIRIPNNIFPYFNDDPRGHSIIMAFYFLGKSGNHNKIMAIIPSYQDMISHLASTGTPMETLLMRRDIGLWLGYAASGKSDIPDFLREINSVITKYKVPFNITESIPYSIIQDLLLTGYKKNIQEVMKYLLTTPSERRETSAYLRSLDLNDV